MHEGLQHRNYKIRKLEHINKNVKPTRRSLHDFKASWKLPIVVETSNSELHADTNIFIPYTPIMPTVRIHHRLTGIMRAVLYNIPNAILRCFVFDYNLKFFQDFEIVKTKA